MNHPNVLVPQLGQQAPPVPEAAGPAPIGAVRECHIIWQGMLEWLEKPKNSNDPQKLTHNVPCQVSAIPRNGEPGLKADLWPQKLIMQLVPKQLIANIGEIYLKNSKSVLFHPYNCEALKSLTKVMSSGFVGCVHFTRTLSPPTCDVKVLILVYTNDKRAYVGLIPNDQVAFIDQLREVIQHQKTPQTISRRQGVCESPQQSPQGNVLMIQMGGVVTFSDQEIHQVVLGQLVGEMQGSQNAEGDLECSGVNQPQQRTTRMEHSRKILRDTRLPELQFRSQLKRKVTLRVACTSAEEYLLGMVSCGNVKIVKRLIEHGASVNLPTPLLTTPLLIAIRRRFVQCVEVLLQNGADPNGKCRECTSNDFHLIARSEDALEWSPLSMAATCDMPECVELLLQYGANVNYRAHGISALTEAIRCNSPSCIEILLRNGAEMTITDHMAVNMSQDLNFDKMLLASQNPAGKRRVNKPAMIHSVAMKGDCEALQSLLENGVDVNLKDTNGDTALHIVVREGHLKCVPALLNKRADLNIRNKKGLTVLHIIAECGYADIMALLIAKGAKVNMRDKCDVTPLHTAACHGKEQCVRILLDHGADVNAADEDKLTPLHLAVSSRNKDCMQLLMGRGADTFALSQHPFIPLDFAAIEGVEYFTMLLPTDVNKKGPGGLTSLHVAAARSSDCVKLLLEMGANVNDKTTDEGVTPLHMASGKGHVKSVELLLQHKAIINAKNDSGATPLHFSASECNAECMKLLLQNGASVNCITKTKKTPLHLSAFMGSAHCAQLLINNGCKIDPRDKEGNTPLFICVALCFTDCMKVLLDNGANVFKGNLARVTPLEISSIKGASYFKMLLGTLDKHSKTRKGLTALHIAAAHSSECIELALEQGVNVNVKNNEGSTPLHLAAEQGIGDCIRLLVQHGADVNANDILRLTPLHRAASEGHPDCVELLLQNGASVNAAAVNKFTPLHLAAEEGNADCITVLIENGANINASDGDNVTILMAAAKKAHFDCVRLLLDHDARLWSS